MQPAAPAKAISTPGKRYAGTSRSKFLKALAVAAAKGNDREADDLRNAILQGNVLLTDASIQTTKNGSGRNQINMFENTDEREVGINSLSKSMLQKGQYLLVDSITILGASLFGTTANPTAALVRGSSEERTAFKKTEFVSLDATGTNSALCIVANGELKVRVRNKDVVKEIALHRFVQDNNAFTTVGTLQLDTPFLVRSQESIELILDLPTTTKENTLVRVLLNGTATVPA